MLVFLPTHNGAATIAATIDGLRAQTDPDWRLVVLENGSSDATLDIVRGFGDARIEVHPLPASLGIVANWQRVLAYLRDQPVAPDTLVTITGDDDWFRPGFIARIRELVRADPQASLYHTGFDLVDGRGDVIRPCRPIPERESWLDLAAALFWQQRDSFGTGYVFRAADYIAVGGMPDLPLLLSADHLLFVRLTRLGHKRAAPESLFAYRFHAGSTSGGLSAAKLGASLEAADRMVAAFEAMDGFMQSPRGRDALAALLGHELGFYRLAAVDRVLDDDARRRKARLEGLFEQVARGLPLQTWSDPVGGSFNRATRPLRDLARNLSVWRATRG